MVELQVMHQVCTVSLCNEGSCHIYVYKGIKVSFKSDLNQYASYRDYKGLAQIKQDPSFDVEFENVICQEVSKMHSINISKTHINENEVVVALQKLENRKPPGFDGIVTEHDEIVTEHIKTLKVSYISI